MIAAFAALVAATIPGGLRLRTDSSPEGFFVENHVELARFGQLEKYFGRDRGVRLVLEVPVDSTTVMVAAVAL